VREGNGEMAIVKSLLAAAAAARGARSAARERRALEQLVDDVELTRRGRADLLIGGAGQHAGGRFWFPDDPDYQLVLQWIAEGAHPDP
jgi:hypothetical protein